MMTSKEAIDLVDQQKQIPHPINPGGVQIINELIYYNDGKGRLWVVIPCEDETILGFKEKGNIFILVK